uniref:Secreted protein n=1 Tax=Setaria viridis TaxID=4556 RepID=A0A4V6D835_SETVI|nr:hypothetical protein SEVIR_4G094201v2 [Setaria viridis]
MMQPLMFFHNFRCTLVWFWNTGPCSMSNVLGVDWQIRHEDCNLLSAFGCAPFTWSIFCPDEGHWGRRLWKDLDRYCIFFVSGSPFIIWECSVPTH